MSKLYSNYSKLKQKNPQTIYLFKSGIFYLALNEDSQTLSNILGLKITHLNESVTKCGFPVSRIEHYINLLNANHINFQIVDSYYGVVSNYSEYLNNSQVKKILSDITNLDFDSISFKEAFQILYDISNKLKELQNPTDINTLDMSEREDNTNE